MIEITALFVLLDRILFKSVVAYDITSHKGGGENKPFNGSLIVIIQGLKAPNHLPS